MHECQSLNSWVAIPLWGRLKSRTSPWLARQALPLEDLLIGLANEEEVPA